MTQPLISIITPVGPRHAAHVRTAAASVQWQSLAHLCEHVIACDGGADVAPMAGAVTILPSDGEQRGPAHTRNRALSAARGLFTLPLDADDYLLPNTVAHLLRAYATGRHGYIYGNAYTQERDGTYQMRSAPDYKQEDMQHFNIHVVTALTPTKHWRAVGGWDEEIDAWEDWSGHLRLAMAGVCGYRIPIPIFTYRIFEGDRMTRFYGGDRALMEQVLVRYRNKEGDIPMAKCCGGDADLARFAAAAVRDLAQPYALDVGGGKVRVEYLGEERGSIPWQLGPGRLIQLGNNASHRFADVTREEAAWLGERVPLRIVPIFDGPEAPEPLPVAALVPEPEAPKALKPKPVDTSLLTPAEPVAISTDRAPDRSARPKGMA